MRAGPPPRSDSTHDTMISAASLVARATVFPTAIDEFFTPAPATTFLNGSASGGTPPYQFAWNLGDGANGTGRNVTHDYALPGTYIAVLTVTDTGGRTATSTVVAALASGDQLHSVWVESNVSFGPAPLSVQFTVTGWSDTPKSFAWWFGDGGSAKSFDANHTYVRAGTYVARLNATDSDGLNATSLLTVIAAGGGPPEALATVSVVGFCYRDIWNRADFQPLVGGGHPPYTYSWQFGEANATSASQDPSYSYQQPGVYLANVTVEDSLGFAATSSVSVRPLLPPCPPQFVFPWLGLIVTGAVTGTGLAIVYLEVRKRPKRPS